MDGEVEEYGGESHGFHHFDCQSTANDGGLKE